MIDFRTQKSCMRWGRTIREHMYMFLIDIPFKGCKGRPNRSSIVHAVSMTPHAFLFFFVYHRCFAYDFHFTKLFEKFFCDAVSMTPHAFLKILLSSQILIYIRKGFSPLIRSPGRMFLMKKNRG
jgi:hypothetical protein